MIKAHHVFNSSVYLIVIIYIILINVGSYYHKGTGVINFLVSLFQNEIFRIIFLLITAYFAFDLDVYGGFTLAILLTIAFLNTSMLSTRRVAESFSDKSKVEGEEDEEDSQRGYTIPTQPIENPIQSGDNCGPYSNNYRLPFNPGPYRPDESVMSDGFPDDLPKDPLANGPYTTSGVGYEFNMA